MGSLQPENDAKQELNDSGCVQDDSMGEKYIGQAELLDLSDDVLLYILKHCTPRDLKALGHTCPRLGTLICDRTLWQRVDARSSPTGQERLHWLLTHCLTQGTQELKLTGYVDKHNKCLGIQDPVWPAENGGSSYPETDFILRMWYSHLPRHATSPRWPDKREAAGRAYSRPTESVAMPLSPLTQLASQIVAGTSSGPSCTITDLINSERKPGDFVPRSNHTGTTASISATGTNQSGPSSSCSGPNSSNSGANSSNSGANSSNSGADSSNSGPDSSESGFTSGEASSKDDVSSEKCHGPRFTLNHSLLKSLKSKCKNLTSLTLEYCNLDFKNANLRHFPPKLRKLSLKGTRCYNLPLGTSYLGKIQARLPDLEVLDISECDWFDPASLLPLSKVKNLQELYMRDCRKMSECVAYASLATRYGFQKLRILDLRGSPVGDSEVSALGWLPLLEELYLSPPDNFGNSTEHSHKWDDVLVPFNELDAWETEEPDYYKCKSPTADCMDEGEEPKEEREDVPDGRYRENTFGSYISRSLEQRIIVIHPNRRDWEHECAVDYAVNPFPLQAHPPANPPPANPPPANPPPANPPPANPQPANPAPADNTDHDPSVDPAPGASRRPLKRPNPDRVLDLVKRRFEKHIGISLDIEEEPVDEPLQTIEESNENSNAQESSPKKPRSDSPKPSTSKTDSAEPSTSKSPTQNDDKTPKNPGQPGPQAPNAGGRSFRIGSAEFLLREVPNRPDDGILGRSYLARYCERISGLMEGNPPLAVHARPVRNRPNVEGNRPINAVICGLPEPFGPRRHIRAPLLSIGHHLVTDSAVLRFGRADNNNINYVYIGHNFHANEPGVRPDRSNLRVLSMTGYTYITDRSLEHLATAAPNIRHIDFSFSGITDRGVEVFKAIRPNCEVIFNGKL